MNNQRPSMFAPALIGGAAAGVLTGIPIVGCLCCLWIIGGSILAAYLLSKGSSVALTSGDGAIVGIFTGIIAAIVDFFISIPFDAMSRGIFQNIMERLGQYAEEMPPGWEALFEKGALGKSVGVSLIGFVVSVFVFSALGALGGILGISLFRKKPAHKEQGAIDVHTDPSDR